MSKPSPKPKKPTIIPSFFRWFGDGIIGTIRLWNRLRGSAPGPQASDRQNPAGSPPEVPVSRRGIQPRLRLLRFRVSRFHRKVPPLRIAALYLIVPAALAIYVGFSMSSERPVTRPAPAPEGDKAFRTLLAETTLLIREKKLAEAEKNLAILKSLQPDHPALLSHRGAIALQREEYDQARDIYQQALDANPLSFVANYNLAEIEFISGNYPQATTAFQFLARARPHNEALRYRLFLCAFMMDEDEKAREIVQKMSPVGRTPSWHYAQAALLHRANKDKEARAILSKAQVLYGDKTDPYEASFDKLGIGRRK